MIEGESGILAISPPWCRPKYEPSKRRLTWPNGAIATAYSGDKPDQLRGPQHDGAWGDEVAAWRYPDAWDQLQFGLRLGDDPQVVVTTTPRPTKLIRELLKDPGTFITKGRTADNRGNLAPTFYDRLLQRYEGTRLGRQEMDAELLDDNPLALWKRSQFEASGFRVKDGQLPDLERIVVAVDPSVHDGTQDAEATQLAEAGIIGAGLYRLNGVAHGVILEDRSVFGSPKEWAQAAIDLYHELKADRLVAEINNGGALVETVIRTIDRNVSYRPVHASRGKFTRAEPISSLYEQRRVKHKGVFSTLEDEMAEWTPGEKSPNHLDAMVWALTDLMVSGSGPAQYVDI